VQDLNISIIQSTLDWQDAPSNRAHFDSLITDIEGPTDLVILPETFTTGFTMDSAAFSETMEGDTVAWMKLLAQDFQITLCGSLIIEDEGRYYNRLIWASADGGVEHYDKRHLFRIVDEHEHFSAGTARPVFQLNGWRIRPLICYDLRFPVWSRGINDSDLMIFVANWPASRRSAWQVLLPARAVENQCYVAGVNRVGTDGNDKRYAGESAVIDYLGKPVVSCDDQPCTKTVTLSGAALERYRKKFPAWLDADQFTITDQINTA
jgi:predicted amidohydrolase